MSEEREVRASHEEVEQFVSKLKGFHDSLDPGGQAMLGTILDGAVASDTGGYSFRFRRYADPEQQGGSGEGGTSSAEGWNDLIGWIEEQGEEDSQGFAFRFR